MHCLRAACVALLLCSGWLAHAGGKGSLGITTAVDGERTFWNPTLNSVKVAKVMPGSPAAQVGIAEGDPIVGIEGRPVPGAKAQDLQPDMQREVAQAIGMVPRKPSGELRPVSVVAGPQPR